MIVTKLRKKDKNYTCLKVPTFSNKPNIFPSTLLIPEKQETILSMTSVTVISISSNDISYSNPSLFNSKFICHNDFIVLKTKSNHNNNNITIVLLPYQQRNMCEVGAFWHICAQTMFVFEMYASNNFWTPHFYNTVVCLKIQHSITFDPTVVFISQKCKQKQKPNCMARGSTLVLSFCNEMIDNC